MVSPLPLVLALAAGTPGTTAPPALTAPAGPRRDLARARHLMEADLANRQTHRTEGWVLLSWGLANVAAGGVIAGVAGDDAGWSTAGWTTLAWGAVNTGLALTLARPWAGAPTADEALLALRGDALLAARDDAAQEEEGAAQLFAVNTGLDVAYIVAGALTLVIAERSSPRDRSLEGLGGALIVQGAGLLVFDGVNWGVARHRAAVTRSW